MKPEIEHDVMIIGGGPGGMSAALWCEDLGLSSILFEKETELGGQLRSIFNPINNYIGLRAKNGKELLEYFRHTLEKNRSDLFIGREAVAVNLEKRRVELADGRFLFGKSIIIATGVRRRRLGVEGEREFVRKGILTSGAKDADKVKGKKVVIVGGGDAALENALILSEYADSITLVHRNEEFKARPEFIEQAKQIPNVTLLTNSIVSGFHGNDRLESVTVTDFKKRHLINLPCDFALIRIGVEPNSEMFLGQIKVNPNGYIVVSPECQTSVKSVFAVGDVANPHSPTISTSTGDAATAVNQIFRTARGYNQNPKI